METEGKDWDEIVEDVTNGEYDWEDDLEDDYSDTYDWGTDTGTCGICGHTYCLCCGCDCMFDNWDYSDEDEDEDTEDYEPGEYTGPESFTPFNVEGDTVNTNNNILEEQ